MRNAVIVGLAILFLLVGCGLEVSIQMRPSVVTGVANGVVDGVAPVRDTGFMSPLLEVSPLPEPIVLPTPTPRALLQPTPSALEDVQRFLPIVGG